MVHSLFSESAVWALTSSGSIYRRSGISQQNYCGNTWDLIPGSFKFISGKLSFSIFFFFFFFTNLTVFTLIFCGVLFLQLPLMTSYGCWTLWVRLINY